MNDNSRSFRDTAHRDHHLEHQKAQQEHVEWLRATARWRQEYQEAAMRFVRRSMPELDLSDYEAALDAHEKAMEVAVAIHEQALNRHEKALELEERGAWGASEDFEELHQELDSRHASSREAHRRLEQRHRRILARLRGDH